jgi:hypothetical protein
MTLHTYRECLNSLQEHPTTRRKKVDNGREGETGKERCESQAKKIATLDMVITRKLKIDTHQDPTHSTHALSGLKHDPKFRSGTVRMRKMYAIGANSGGKSIPHRKPP